MKLFGYEITRRKEAQFGLVKIDQGSLNNASGEREYNSYVSDVFKSPTLSSCIGVWTSTFNEAPLVVMKDGAIDLEHPLSKLFQKPNSYFSQAQFFQYVALYVAIGGNAYIHKVKNQLGQTIELHIYNDAQIQPIPSANDYLAHYLYNFNNVKAEIPKDDIIHLRSIMPNPTTALKGLSPLALVNGRVAAEYNLAEMVSSTIKNGGIPTTVFRYTGEGQLSTDAIDQIKLRWKERRKEGAGKESIAVLPAKLDVLSYAQNFSDMVLPDLWTKTDVEICAAYRVPVVVAQAYASLQNSTYNNVKEGYRQFTELTRIPMWNLWEEQIELSFAKEYPGVDVEFDLTHVQALQPDPEKERANIILQVEKSIITPNEARVLLGYEEREINTVAEALATLPAIVQNQILSVLTNNEKRAIAELPPIDGGDVIAQQPTQAPAPTKEYKEADVWTEEKKLETWQKYETERAIAEKEFIEAFAKVVGQLEKEVTGKLNKKELPFNLADWITKFQQATYGTVLTLVQKVVGFAWQEAGALDSLGDAEENIYVESVAETNDKIAESIGVIRDELKQLLSDNAGRTTEQLLKAMKDKFAVLKESRAQVIARTTTTSSVSGTQKKVWNEYNKRQTDNSKKVVRVWLTQRDSKVRDSHANLDGVEENKDGKFDVGGHLTDRPAGSGLPASEACNCRCITIPRRKGKI